MRIRDLKNIYYVYVILDPRKPGSYQYNEYHFDYEPFYVGKGKRDRDKWHINCIGKKGTSHRVSKVIKIYKETGDLPIIVRVEDKLYEHNAINIEINLIELIGRINCRAGPLVNLTNGGEGLSGYICPENEKLLKSEILRKRNQKNRMCGIDNPFYGRKHSEDILELQRQAKRGQNNPKFGKKDSIETRVKKSQKLKEYNSRPEVREAKRLRVLGEKNPMFGKTWKQSVETCEKKRQSALAFLAKRKQEQCQIV